jgi:transposase
VFIKPTTKTIKGKTYTNHLLVESISTPKGPRHRILCSLGSLAPAPRQDWLALARKIEAALTGQTTLLPDPKVDGLVENLRHPRRPGRPRKRTGSSEIVSVLVDQIEMEKGRQAGAVHVGHQMWNRLGLDSILEKVGLDQRTRLLTEVMTLNRLVHPASEHAMPGWIRRTGLAEILKRDFSPLNDQALYRNLDQLHPQRTTIEAGLAARERDLFNLSESIYLYDLTSTYFEGQCEKNPKAKRGYSRDHRPDCKQVVVGLVLDGDGFPKAHEVLDGNRNDSTTVDEMLAALEKPTGRIPGATVVVDRGMACKENLRQITARGYHYLVAARQPERYPFREQFEDERGWEEILREPSPNHRWQKKSHVTLKRCVCGPEVHILCLSEDRQQKDRAIRELHEKRLVGGLQKLSERIRKKRLRGEAKVGEAIGRLKQRYSRVARYYEIVYDPVAEQLIWTEQADKKRKAERLDGGYLLKTDRQDLTPEEIWRAYILLTRVESAFRAIKSPLLERPVFHQLERRVETHIFLCVLAYHLLVCVEKTFRDQGIYTSWESIREELSTHQIVTVVLPTSSGDILTIRKATTAEPEQRKIYQILRIPETIIQPIKTWQRA